MLTHMFSLNIEAIDDVTICRIHGEIDSASAASLREAMGTLAASHAVVLDFAGVPFIDSAGLGTLIGGTRRIREGGGDVVLCSPRRAIDRLLHAVGMERILPILETLPDALLHFEQVPERALA